MSEQTDGANGRRVEADWAEALAERDFGRLAGLCRPDVPGRFMTPDAVQTADGAQILARKLQQWFGESDLLRVEQTETHTAGEKLSVSYRIIVRKRGEWFEVEQRLSGDLRDGLISRLDLHMSDLKPAQPPGSGHAPDAFLLVEAPSVGGGSTCAILTPAIKSKLREMSSGQLLQVQVDDATARGDIEAWCRLSGNELLAVTPAESGRGLDYLLRKK